MAEAKEYEKDGQAVNDHWKSIGELARQLVDMAANKPVSRNG